MTEPSGSTPEPPDPLPTSVVAVPHPSTSPAHRVMAPHVDSSSSSPVQATDSTPKLPWAARLKSSLRNLKKSATPSYREDGIPVVTAPASVLLKASEQWADFLVAHFLSIPPPSAKIYSDLNPIWGKFGNISLQRTSKLTYLIHIPNRSTREWVLQIGYWQTDNCGFVVSDCTPTGSLEQQEMTSVPIWVKLSNIPYKLFTLEGIGLIASAIGEPLHTENSRLNHARFGEAKVKVEIQIDS